MLLLKSDGRLEGSLFPRRVKFEMRMGVGGR